MTWDELNAIIQRHGGTVSAPVVVDPVIDNPTEDLAERRLNPKVTNPNPTYRYNLKDGKQFTAKATASDENGGATAFQIVDPGSAVQPLTPADRLPSAAQDLVKLDARGNVIPPGDTTTPAAKLRDPSTGAVTDLDPKGPAEGTVKEFGNQLLNIKPDGTYTVITSKSADPAAAQAKSTFDGPDGARYEYDPNKSAGTRLTKLIDAPPDKTAPTTKEVDGQQFQWDPAAGAWKSAPGLPSATKPATASTNTGARWVVFYDDKGNEVSRRENPNYQPTPPTQLTPDAVSQNIPLLKPDGTVQWVPNQNRVTAGQAMQDMLAQLNVAVDGKQLGMDDAKSMLTGAVNIMNAQSQQTQAQAQQAGVARAAAGDILTAQTEGARTGAGLINQRVQAGQGMLTSALNLAGQRPMVGLQPGAGQALMGDIQNFTTQLGGGQAVYDTAARLVQANDPQGGNSPMAAQAYGVLSKMFEQYQQKYNQPHPAVAATQAAAATQQNGAVVAPQTLQPIGPIGSPQFAAAQQSAQASTLPPSPMTAPAGGMAALNPINPATGQPYPSFQGPTRQPVAVTIG